MGAYSAYGTKKIGETHVSVWQSYYKFANFAKEDIERNVVKGPMKWKSFTMGYSSSTHDGIVQDGVTHDKVTFFIVPIHFKTK